MDEYRIPNSIFNNQPEGNTLRGRSRNHWLNCVQADLKKYLIGSRGQPTVGGRDP